MARGRCDNPDPNCKYAAANRGGGCFSDEHHLFYPRNEYSDPIAKRWRDLGKNTVQLCRRLHDDIHAQDSPPPRPTRETMAYELLNSDEHLTRNVRDALQAFIRKRELTKWND